MSEDDFVKKCHRLAWNANGENIRSESMKWVHIKDSIYKCPNCGTRFIIIRKKWVCCPVCGQKLSGVKERDH